MHFIRKILRKILIAYLIVMAVFALIQRKMMYPATQAPQLPVAAFPQLEQTFHSASDVEITTGDKVIIRGWFLQAAAKPSDRLMLLFHGNGGNRAHRGNWYTIAHSLDADVLAMDYHGYGDSGGSPSEAALIMDAEAAWEHAVNVLRYKPSQIVLVGESLGGAVSVQLAATMSRKGTPPAGLVLVATFSSMLDVARDRFWWLPVRWLLLDRYRSDKAITQVTCPILQFHGDLDTLVALPFGMRLYELVHAKSSGGIAKEFHLLRGAGHNDILDRYGRFIRDEMAALIR